MVSYDYRGVKAFYHYRGIVGVEHDNVIYKIKWRPGTLAEDVICALQPFPTCDSPGVFIDGNEFHAMDAQSTADFQASCMIADDERDDIDRRNLASTITLPEFQCLPLVNVDPAIHFEKAPRSAGEINNLLSTRGQPGVVQLVGRTTDKIVLERCGESIGSWIRDRSVKVPSVWKDQWCLDLAQSLQMLHSKGILHWDLTYDNALHKDNRAILCDLEGGVSTFDAPERFAEPDYVFDKRCDIFALGLLLWSVQMRNMPRPQVAKCLPREGIYATIMDKCLDNDPAKRPDIDEVVLEMKQLFKAAHPDE